ncbi:MAG: hypothetical protein MK085_03940, partial [Phycisphaerales bacterium]|nr:hypothetical protein [Phycisphaerales bacterium]
GAHDNRPTALDNLFARHFHLYLHRAQVERSIWLSFVVAVPRSVVVGGVSLFNTYSVDDPNGNRRAESDLDPAPFIGVFGSYRF